MNLDSTKLVDPMTPELFKVQRVEQETHDTFTLTLTSSNDQPIQFAPGQFNMMYVFGQGEVPISISGDPDNNTCWVHTIRAVGKTTHALCRLKKGDVVGLRGPFGTSWPWEKALGKHAIVVAGGIGFAPLRPLLYALKSRAGELKSLQLYCGTRSPDDLIFQNECKEWQKENDISIHLTVDHADTTWSGNVGVVTEILQNTVIDAENTVAYTCGPEIMMEYVVKTLMGQDVAEDNIFVSMERNMHCAVGYCGHCQWGPHFICKDGPIYPYANIKPWLRIREL